jgi:hypothetical protein
VAALHQRCNPIEISLPEAGLAETKSGSLPAAGGQIVADESTVIGWREGAHRG